MARKDDRGEPGRIVAAYVEARPRELVCGFAGGTVVRVPLRRLGLAKGAPVRLAAPDELGAGVVLVRTDGTREDCAADFILRLAGGGRTRRKPAGRRALARRVASRLRRLRIQAGIKQHEMARRLDLAPPNYSRLESGAHAPSVALIVRIAEELDVPLDQLVAEEG